MAVIDDLKTYYKDLLILQYISKPNARAHIDVLSDIAIMDNLPVQVRDAFSVDGAIGVQLDTVGKYLDVTRYSYGNVSSSDDDFRVIIKLAILKNNANSDLWSIQDLIVNFFPNSQIIVFDYKTMRMSYYIDTSAMTRELAELIESQGLLPVPMAVELSATIYRGNIDKLYGLRGYIIDTANIKGFNNYTAYDNDAPWLSYVDAL